MPEERRAIPALKLAPPAWGEPDGATAALASPSDARVRELAAKPLNAQRRHHPGQWVSAVIVTGFMAWLVKALAQNGLIGWSAVRRYLFSADILHGLLGTLELTGASMAVAVVLGFILAALGASANPVLAWFVRGYVWIFRGVPLIVQILAWYNLALVFPVLAVGVPFSNWHLQSLSTASRTAGPERR
jgi:polar amino acid transport system permease protein